MKVTKYLLLIFIVITSPSLWANSDIEKEYLFQILNQLNAIKPLVISAAKQQPKNNRFHFHYIAYKDMDGKTHNGLLEDINEIQNGIMVRLNKIPNEPHSFSVINGDYINQRAS